MSKGLKEIVEFVEKSNINYEVIDECYHGAIVIETDDPDKFIQYLADEKIDFRYKTLFKGTIHNFYIYIKGLPRLDISPSSDFYYPYHMDEYAEYHF